MNLHIRLICLIILSFIAASCSTIKDTTYNNDNYNGKNIDELIDAIGDYAYKTMMSDGELFIWETTTKYATGLYLSNGFYYSSNTLFK